MNTSWKELIREAMAKNGEGLADIVATTLSKEQLSSPFADDSSFPRGKPFTAWSKTFVYFPAVKFSLVVGGEMAMCEYVASAPRHVQKSVAVEHVGYW